MFLIVSGLKHDGKPHDGKSDQGPYIHSWTVLGV